MLSRRGLVVLGGALLLWALVSGRANAQTIQLDTTGPLQEGLQLLQRQTSLDLVYAERLVREARTACRYNGTVPVDALACLLRGTGLEARRVRRHQYVLVQITPAAPTPQRVILSGYVLDAETGEELPGAHIMVRDLRLGVISNAAGYFALPALPPGAYRVRISYLGYARTDTLLEAGAGRARIALKPTTLSSDSLVVESRRDERVDLSLLPGLVAPAVRDLEVLPAFPGDRDLFQALQWIPGVQRVGEINGGLMVRGGAPDQNLYLLDGAPVYHPWHAFSLISTFQADTFKDIKLYRSAFPAEHGGRLSAVLDAQMKDGSRRQPSFVGAVSPLSGRFVIESPATRTTSFMVSGRRSYIDKLIGETHPVSSPDGARDTLRTGYYFYDQSAKLTWRPNSQHQVSFSYYHGKDNLDLRLPFDLSLDGFSLDFFSSLDPPDLFFDIDHFWSNRLFSLRHQYLPSSRWFVTTTLYRTSYRAQEAAVLRPTDQSQLISDYRVQLRDLGVKVDADAYLALAHQLRMGVQVIHRAFESGLDATIERSTATVDTLQQSSVLDAWEVVAYLQDTWQPTPAWRLQPGLRASYFTRGDYARLSPRFTAQYTISPRQVALRAAVGSQVQYLHRLRDRYSYIYDLVSQRWVPASSAVRPSRSIQASMGTEVYPRSWLQVGVDVYGTISRHILLPEDTYRTKDGLEGPGVEVGALLGQYTPGRSRQYGVELTARAERAPWQAWGSLVLARSWTRAPQQGETRYRPARFDAPQAFRGVLTYDHRRWTLSLSADARSGYPESTPVGRYVVQDPLDAEPTPYLHRPQRNNGRLPVYLRLDALVGYRFGLAGADWRLQMTLHNLTNRKNVLEREYDPTRAGIQATDLHGVGVLPFLELEVSL
ncbi:MAG: TonB-dependent receptor [Bacteroidota bacterium]